MRAGALVMIGALLAFAGILGLAAAIVVGVATYLGLMWGFVAASAFVLMIAGLCILFAADEPAPVERKPSTAPDYSPLLRIVEDVASDVIAGPNERHAAGGTTKALVAALTAGAVLGFTEQLTKKSV